MIHQIRTLCALSLLSAAPAQGTISRSELVATLAARHAALHSVQVEFSYAERGVRGHHVFADLAFLGNKLMRLDSGHGWDGFPWTRFYARSRSFVADRQYDVLWPNKLAYESRQLRKDEQLERFEVQGWVRATGFWPDDAALPSPEFFGSNLNVLAAARDERYALSTELEDHEGTPCLILERPKFDRIALDPARGYAVLARWWFAKDKPAMDVVVHDLEECVEGVFLPKAYRLRTYMDGDGKPLREMVELNTTVHATHVGTLEESDFRMVIPPGALRFDRRHPERMKQTEPGGVEYLFRQADRLEASYATRHGSSSTSWLWLALGVVVSWILAWCVPAFRVVRPTVGRSSRVAPAAASPVQS